MEQREESGARSGYPESRQRKAKPRKKAIVNPQQAYRYLDRFKGIDFVDKFLLRQAAEPSATTWSTRNR